MALRTRNLIFVLPPRVPPIGLTLCLTLISLMMLPFLSWPGFWTLIVLLLVFGPWLILSLALPCSAGSEYLSRLRPAAGPQGLAHCLETPRAGWAYVNTMVPLKREMTVRWKPRTEGALLWAFRGCILLVMTRMTVTMERVSRTMEGDGLSLGKVSTGKLEVRQRGRGRRSTDERCWSHGRARWRCYFAWPHHWYQQPMPF